MRVLFPQLLALLLAAATLGLAPAASAGSVPPACPDRTPLPITAPAAASVKCQQAIAKEGARFLKTKTSALSKCLQKSAPGSCPAAADVAKTEQAAQKAAAKIAKACGDDAVQSGLSSSYGALSDDGEISSCVLSQHNAIADLLVANAVGVSTEDFAGEDNKARGKCIKEAAKSGVKFALSTLSAMSKCIDGQIKKGAAGDLAAVCVGSVAAGGFVLPSDAKTAKKLGKQLQSLQSKIAKKCGPGAGSWLPSIFACDGAQTADELSSCLSCQGWQSAVDFVEQQYAENGTLVSGAIQDAVDAASAGDKLLIPSGDYQEEIVLGQPGLQLVGCGGATNDRPVILRPDGVGPFERGVFASDLDGLLFQSLVVDGWDGDGIFVTGADGVTFRDIVGEGRRNSRYAVFPVNSSNIVIEGCLVKDVADAGIYVGQSSNLVVRHNKVLTSVAGVEFENSAYGEGYDNYVATNTGGFLVFKDGTLPVQLSNNHRVSHNVIENNNEPNYGSGNVGNVPDGTGILVISTDDSVFEYNVVRGNDSFGIGVVDEVISGFGPPFAPDQKTERNTIRRNQVTGNALAPDTTPPNDTPLSSDIVLALAEWGSPADMPTTEDHGNCFEGNVTDLNPLFFPPTHSQCGAP
jgi:parallel beta-helix repeat protein